MVIADVIPNVDIDTEWNTWGPGATHEARIDEDKGSPDTVDAIVCDSGDNNLTDSFHMDNTIQNCQEYTQVKVRLYQMYLISTEGGDCKVNIYVNGSWQGDQIIHQDAIPIWRSYTWAGLSGNQASLDDLRVRVTTEMMVTGKYITDLIRVYTMYAEITYTEPVVEGWGHNFLGVPSANIGKVCGVPTANIANIKGV